MKKSKKIKIYLNGKKKNLENEITIKKVLKLTNVQLNKVAIELNNEIVNKKMINKIKLKNDDKIEIVHFIGGG
tara:strand:- start:2521 stop:2739 length:219 start_codon:yes stop_codon:yes gene_type:complete